MKTITFEEWRRRFEKTLVVGTPAWTALQASTEYLRQPPSGFPTCLIVLLSEDPGWVKDIQKAVLRLMYSLTLHEERPDQNKRNRDANTRKTLLSLTLQVEDFVTHLKKNAELDRSQGSVMISPSGEGSVVAVDLYPLVLLFEDALEVSRYFLEYLEPMYLRQRDILDNCIALIMLLENRFQVPERQTLELVRLVMLAHGYPKDGLEDFRNPLKIRAGNFRKRKQTSEQRFDSVWARLLRDTPTGVAVKFDGAFVRIAAEKVIS